MFGNKKTGFCLVADKIISKTSHCMGGNAKWEGKLFTVIECNELGDCVCLDEGVGMATIDACDVKLFIPLDKENGNLYPTQLSFTEKINWTGMCFMFPDYYNAAVVYFSTLMNRAPVNADFKLIYKMCENPSQEVISFSKLIKQNAKTN